ncbi:MAG: hypothetical protein RLZZ347_869 [Candidatus Parcubacteria bacterium]|jgi:hypothetical protein
MTAQEKYFLFFLGCVDIRFRLSIMKKELYFERLLMITISPIPPELLPISKSRAIRLLFLGLRDGDDSVIHFISRTYQRGLLPDDVVRMLDACRFWNNNQNIQVGESATVLRFLWWLSQAQKSNKNFVREGTLLGRKITLDPEMLNWTIKDLLDPERVPERTSQLASVATLHNPDRYRTFMVSYPHHLAITYEVLDQWYEYKRFQQKVPLPAPGIDATIEAQAKAFLLALRGGGWQFEMLQQEDFPFAYIMTDGDWALREARKRWPSLAEHESNRFTEVAKAKSDWAQRRVIDSADHRVIQAITMFAMLNRYKVKDIMRVTRHPKAVAKSWPAFYMFLDWVQENGLK